MADEFERIMRQNTERQIAADRQNTDNLIAADRQNTYNLIAAEERSSEMIRSQIFRAQYENARNFGQLSGQIQSASEQIQSVLQSGFSEVSQQIEVMGTEMLWGIGWLAGTVEKAAAAICDRLDELNDIANNPSRTKARELYRRALTEYTKKLYREALNDAVAAVTEHQTDVVSWFLLGKIYLEGRTEIKELDEIVDVRDPEKAIEAFKNAARYIKSDAETNDEARLLAAQIWFYLGSAQMIKSWGETESAGRDDVSHALESFERSRDHFQERRQKLEVRHRGIARCRVLLGDVPGALQDVKAIILEDPSYYKEKVENDPYFSPIRRKSHA
jgi:tetratricopeptide (TPR) repeat protein